MRPEFVVHGDATSLAEAVAARLVARLVEATTGAATAHVSLTGGGPGTAALRCVGDSISRDAVPWRNVEVWWSDERFLPAGDPQRNETQARQALLDTLPLAPARVHAMAASDGPYGGDPDAAAAGYAEELAASTPPGQVSPEFDVLLLGMGAEGHVASIFPESPAAVDSRPVVAVLDSPKPPSTRVSFTFPTICRAKEVWIVTAGTAKAQAISLVAAGAGRLQVPAAGAVGTRRTLFLIDRQAAAGLPADLRDRAV